MISLAIAVHEVYNNAVQENNVHVHDVTVK